MASNKTADFFDFHALLEQYKSKWYLFVIAVVLSLGLGYLVCRVYQRPMAVKANLLIQKEGQNPMANMGALGDIFGSKGVVDDELYVIDSHTTWKMVVKELQVNKLHYVSTGFLKKKLAYPEFPVDVIAPGVADTLRYVISFKIKVNENGLASVKAKADGNVIADEKDVKLPTVLKTDWGNFEIVPTPDFEAGKPLKTNITFMGYDAAAENLSKKVVFAIASKKSSVIQMNFETPNPAYGVAILDEAIEKYNERGIADKNIQNEKTAQFLKERIAILAADLSASESAIQKYKESNGIVDVGTEAAFQTTKRGTLEQSILGAETERVLLKMTSDFLNDSINKFELVPISVGNAAVMHGIESYNALVMRRLDLMEDASGSNYALRKVENQLDLTRENILSSIKKAYENSTVSLSRLKAEQAHAMSSLSAIPTQEREYLDMKRQQEVKQQLYLFLLQREEETAMLLANSVPKGLVIDQAYTMIEPLGLSKMVIMILFLIFGISAVPFWLLCRKLVNNKFESRDEAARRLSAPMLGEMCVDRSGRKLVVSATDTSSATELFRLMRTNLLFMLPRPEDKVVLMTSTRSGEGKTFISINLAASLALLENKKVLLVGMDIRNPQLANYLDMDPMVGLTNYLSSTAVTLKDIINPMPGVPHCDVICAGPIPPNPAELLASKRTDELFEQLRGMYDYIIVDSAPVGMVSDTFSLNRLADATVYVTRVNFSTLVDLKFIEDLYTQKRLTNLSVVVNGTSSKKGYGYGYSAKQGAK